MLESLTEQDVTLHILTESEFRFSKPNASRQFLGILKIRGICQDILTNQFFKNRFRCWKWVYYKRKQRKVSGRH